MNWQTVKETAINLYDKLHAVQIEYFYLWKNHVIFTWRWWLALSLVIIPWTIWIIVRKRESTYRLLFAGFFVAIISSLMDAIGVTMHLWTYPVTVLPLMPSYIPFDLSSMPVATMLWLQFFPKMRLIYKALIYALVGGYLFEPLIDWIGLSVEEGWKYSYSVLIMFVVYLMADFFATRDQFEKIK